MRARSIVPLVIVAAMAAALPAAGQTPGGVRIAVTHGFDDRARASSANPITILVEADRLFAGSIQAEVPTGDGPPSIYERPIEVPGGSRKVVRLVLPRASVDAVRAVGRDGRVVANVAPTPVLLERGEPLVGVLTGLPVEAPTVQIRGLREQADLVKVEPEIVDLGAAALMPLSHLVVDATMLPRLSPRQRDAVAAFAGAGGELVVAAGPGTDLSFLPRSWRAGGGGVATRARAGAGEVVVASVPFSSAEWGTGGRMWSEALRPVNVLRWGTSQNESWQRALGAAGGFRTAPFRWLFMFLVGYVVVAGPLGFLTLSRMRRRDLAWVVIPSVALLFAVGAFIAGRGVRSGPLRRGVAIAVVMPEAERVDAAVGVLSRDGGTERVTFTDDWRVDLRGAADRARRVRASGGNVTSEFPLSVGDVGTAIVSRARLVKRSAAGVVTAGAGTPSVRVRNVSGFDIDNASVFVGRTMVGIGPLADGKAFAGPLDLSRSMPFIDDEVWLGGFTGSGPSRFFLTSLARSIIGMEGSGGAAYLVGVARLEKAGPALGLGAIEGTLLVAMPLQLDVVKGQPISGFAVVRELLATDSQPQRLSQFDDSFAIGKDFTVRFSLPRSSRPRTLTLHHGVTRARPSSPSSGVREVWYYDWRRDSWRRVGASVSGSTSLPRTALSPTNDVHIRVTSDFQMHLPSDDLSIVATT